METTSNELQLESILKEMRDILYNQIGAKERFDDLDKSIVIMEQRNKNHYPSIVKKVSNFTRVLYEIGVFRNVNDTIYSEFINKLKDVDILIDKIIRKS